MTVIAKNSPIAVPTTYSEVSALAKHISDCLRENPNTSNPGKITHFIATGMNAANANVLSHILESYNSPLLMLTVQQTSPGWLVDHLNTPEVIRAIQNPTSDEAAWAIATSTCDELIHNNWNLKFEPFYQQYKRAVLDDKAITGNFTSELYDKWFLSNKIHIELSQQLTAENAKKISKLNKDRVRSYAGSLGVNSISSEQAFAEMLKEIMKHVSTKLDDIDLKKIVQNKVTNKMAKELKEKTETIADQLGEGNSPSSIRVISEIKREQETLNHNLLSILNEINTSQEMNKPRDNVKRAYLFDAWLSMTRI